jgi:hypothetical protein
MYIASKDSKIEIQEVLLRLAGKTNS